MRAILRWGLIASIFASTCYLAVAQTREFKPATDETLKNPSPNDWPSWRRTLSAWGYSPLTQINRTNVKKLQMVWGWSMRPGMQEGTPIVYDGVMYMSTPGSGVDALDAASGELIWQYTRDFPPDQARRRTQAMRGISIYDDKIYINTIDAHVVALDARTGSIVWDTQVADTKQGFYYGAGPLIVKGKVISGLEGCDRFFENKCALTALDAKTGKEIWRTITIAKPNEPGDKTWGDVQYLFRAGTDMWITGSYDADLNLIYWPVDQAKPWASAARGTEGEALYSDSTIAVDPDTGKIVWYRQYVPNETHDMDDSFENILVDVGGRKSLFEMGKLGILWETDRKTGKHVHATDLGYQNLVNVDPETGKAEYRPGMIPKLNQEIDFCPSFGGVKSWRAMSYHPETHAFYIPIELTCQKTIFTDVKKTEGGGGVGQGMRENTEYPPSDGNLGEFMALDTSGKILWKHRQRSAFNTAALTTAGGLAFVGDWNRYINAYDVKTGELLWQTRTLTSAQGFPISYSVRGRQYIAVPIGVDALSWGSTIPAALTPDLKRPNTGNGIVVFALPETAANAGKTDTSSPPYAKSETAAGGGISNRNVFDRIFTEAQASRGQDVFTKNCASCHEQGASRGEGAPSLLGGGFMAQWSNHSVSELYTRIRTTMPQDKPGTLSGQEYTDVLSFLLRVHDIPSGTQELKSEDAAKSTVKIVDRP